MLLDCYCFHGTTLKPTSTHNEPTELSAVQDIFSSVGYVLLTSFTDYCGLKVAFKARCSRVNEFVSIVALHVCEFGLLRIAHVRVCLLSFTSHGSWATFFVQIKLSTC